MDCSIETETWKPVCGYEGLYEISDKGRVKSLAKEVRHPSGALIRMQPERIMKIMKNAKGYEFADLYKDGKRFHGTVHRMVLSAFCPVENMDSLTVNHKDFDKSNNTLENLEWTTNYENIQHSVDAGKHHAKTNKNKSPFFSTKKNHKLKPEDVVEIRNLLDRGTKLKEISDRYSVSESLISNIKNNKMWVNYEWESENVNS